MIDNIVKDNNSTIIFNGLMEEVVSRLFARKSRGSAPVSSVIIAPAIATIQNVSSFNLLILMVGLNITASIKSMQVMQPIIIDSIIFFSPLRIILATFIKSINKCFHWFYKLCYNGNSLR